MTTLRVYYEMIQALRAGQNTISKTALNQAFRGITNTMQGYWNIVGVTRQAKEVMDNSGWKKNFAKGLVRDHMKSAKEFQDILMSSDVSFEEFETLVADYGRVVVVTKAQNPYNEVAYGNTYHNEDILYLNNPLESALGFGVPVTKTAQVNFKEAK